MSNHLESLDWPFIQDLLEQYCLTPYGKERWIQAPFFESPSAARDAQAEVFHLDSWIRRMGAPHSPNKPLLDVRPCLNRLSIGGTLSLTELGSWIQTLAFSLPLLQQLSDTSEFQQTLNPFLETLLTLMDPDESDLLDSASPELLRLRSAWRQQRQKLIQDIQNYANRQEIVSMLQSVVVSERDGRFVLPVKASFKSSISGIVHSGSASGATVYMEPMFAIESNNTLHQLQDGIQQEVTRILVWVSGLFCEHSAALEACLEALGYWDKHLAAGMLSVRLDGSPCEILSEDEPLTLKLNQAKHPLLVHQKETLDHDVIANNIALGGALPEENHPRCMIITGPNTGGKTVLLKTVGLLALMLHAGLTLPVAEASAMSWFSPVFVDIGDQQSITQNLSTFSAHILQLKKWLDPELSLKRALILIDEIAAGTDPAEGAALAKALLHEFYERGALVMASTHLGEMKLEAHEHPGYVNASVAFDTQTLSPTYRLLLGTPGSSNAITIASRLGLPEHLTSKASQLLNAPQRDASMLIESLEMNKIQAESEYHRARSYRDEIETVYNRLQEERQAFQEQRRQLLNQFRDQLLGKMNRIETQVNEIQTALGADEISPLDARGHQQRMNQLLSDARAVFLSEAEHLEAEEDRLNLSELVVGQKIKSKRLGLIGELTQIDTQTQTLTLQAGLVRVTIDLADAQWVKEAAPRRKTKILPVQSSQPFQSSKPAKKDTLIEVSDFVEVAFVGESTDLRGLRVDIALTQLDQFLDQSLLSGQQAVAVIHGHGTGALKKAIRDRLASQGFVKSFKPAEARDGGDGKTIVYFV
ncbi:MAG: Smr/MutS family protein [Cyanobacteria bacterium]|nr:Smr/MutS family protein [Cyanobacteriota bacterium]